MTIGRDHGLTDLSLSIFEMILIIVNISFVKNVMSFLVISHIGTSDKIWCLHFVFSLEAESHFNKTLILQLLSWLHIIICWLIEHKLLKMFAHFYMFKINLVNTLNFLLLCFFLSGPCFCAHFWTRKSRMMEVYKPKDKVSTLLFEVLNLSSFSVSDDFHCLYNMHSLNISQLVLDICVKYVSEHLVLSKMSALRKQRWL